MQSNCLFICFSLFFYVFVCMHIGRCVGAGVHTCVCFSRSWLLMLEIFLDCSPHHSLRQCLSTKPRRHRSYSEEPISPLEAGIAVDEHAHPIFTRFWGCKICLSHEYCKYFYQCSISSVQSGVFFFFFAVIVVFVCFFWGDRHLVMYPRMTSLLICRSG